MSFDWFIIGLLLFGGKNKTTRTGSYENTFAKTFSCEKNRATCELQLQSTTDHSYLHYDIVCHDSDNKNLMVAKTRSCLKWSQNCIVVICRRSCHLLKEFHLGCSHFIFNKQKPHVCFPRIYRLKDWNNWTKSIMPTTQPILQYIGCIRGIEFGLIVLVFLSL